MTAQTKTPKHHILITEDEPALARTLLLKLEHVGFSVTLAHNGQEALDLIQKGKFDLIVLDLIMPVMDGWEVLAKCHERGITTPIIVASNLGQESDIAKAKELGAVDYLIKSNTTIKEITERIASHIPS